jgi:hypothetical protein
MTRAQDTINSLLDDKIELQKRLTAAQGRNERLEKKAAAANLAQAKLKTEAHAAKTIAKYHEALYKQSPMVEVHRLRELIKIINNMTMFGGAFQAGAGVWDHVPKGHMEWVEDE